MPLPYPLGEKFHALSPRGKQQGRRSLVEKAKGTRILANDRGMAAGWASFPGDATPFRVADPKPILTQGSAGAQPWAEGLNPFGIR